MLGGAKMGSSPSNTAQRFELMLWRADRAVARIQGVCTLALTLPLLAIWFQVALVTKLQLFYLTNGNNNLYSEHFNAR